MDPLDAVSESHRRLQEHDRTRPDLVAERAKAIALARDGGYKLREIADALGVTVERVRQMAVVPYTWEGPLKKGNPKLARPPA